MVRGPDRPDGARPGPGGGDAARRAARRRAHLRRVQRRRRLAALGGLAVILITLFIATVRVSEIPEDVTISGVDVSGMDFAAAQAALAPTIEAHLGKIVEFRTGEGDDVPIDLPARVISSGADVARAFEAARSSRGRLGRLMSRFGIAGRRDIPLTYFVRSSALTTVTDHAQANAGAVAISARVQMEGTRIAIRAGREGRSVDRRELQARTATLPDVVDVPLRIDTPEVTTATAQQAVALAERMRAVTRSVTYRQSSTPLTPGTVTKALTFTNSGAQIVVGLRAGVVRDALSHHLSIPEREPRDARWRLAGEVAELIPARRGTHLDVDALAATLRADPDVTTLAASVITERPRRTTEAARSLGIAERVSTFTTPYDCCQNRVINIARAARILDGTIIPAGATFSLNDALGERTMARGFVEAPSIEGGEIKPTVGGGVSQVATTLYNAAFFAGLDIVANTPHSFYFPRYPRGREATISWREPDLVFRNNWDAAVLVSVGTSANAITISMYSTKFGRRVETTTSEPANLVEPKTIERLKPELEPGTENIVQGKGQPGFSISYTRRVYRDDDLISDRTWYWTYKPEDEIIEKGPPKPDEPTPTGTTPTGTTTTTTTTTGTSGG